jgi:NAD+ synthase
MFDAVKIKNELVEWIRNWFKQNGPDCNAVIGISGGKDSTVAAALCAEALGADRVIGVMMPNGFQADQKDAIAICEFLNIRYCEAEISDIYETFLETLAHAATEANNNCWIMASNQAKINLAPRIRMAMLYGISQTLNGRVVCTDNLSESYIGYSTRWGDNVGDFAPLANLTSEEVVAIGDALNLPYDLVHKTPADGLCGKTDEDNFGFTYAELNKYIRMGICENQETEQKIDQLHHKNLFKLNPIPKFNYKPVNIIYYENNLDEI